MKGEAQNLLCFSNNDYTFEVPFFQRPYVWNEKNWEDLLKSINDEANGKMPFIGSFIFQYTQDEKTFLVIDGQQRITTLSILIKAFIDKMGDKLDSTIKGTFMGIIYRTQVSLDLKPLYSPRLIPSICDKQYFDIIMLGDKINTVPLNCDEPMILAYRYFKNEFDKMEYNELTLLGGKILTKYEFFLIIFLGHNDNEQKIFDSVNNFGQRLTFADIIKNYMFQRLRSLAIDSVRDEEVMKIYKSNWDIPFYSNDRKNFWYEWKNLGKQNVINLEEFLKDFATIKQFYSSNDTLNLSEAYKKYINNLNYDELINLTIEIKDYANMYYSMINEFKDMNDCRISDVINTTLLILNELDSTTFTPVVLYLFKVRPIGYEEVLKELQKFVLTRLIYGQSIKNYNKIAEVLLEKKDSNEQIRYLRDYNNKSDIDYRNYPIWLKYINSRNDNKAALILFLIEMIRRNKYGEDKYSDTLIFNKTLEHIMPQKWNKWSTVPCYDFNAEGVFVQVTNQIDIEQIRNKKIYSIGNLTLLNAPLNSSIGNDIFEIKINGKIIKNKTREGIRKYVGSLSIAREIVDAYDDHKTWDERDINMREEKLFNELNEFFNFSSTYIPQKTPIVYSSQTDVEVSTHEVKNSLTDDFLNNESIGIVVQESMKYLMKNNLLNDNDVNELQNKEFSSKVFGCWLPVLALSVDEKNRKRYYKETFEYKNKMYLLCKELYKEDRIKIVQWIKSKINLY